MNKNKNITETNYIKKSKVKRKQKLHLTQLNQPEAGNTP